MYTPLALLALIAPATLAVPCGSNFTIGAAADNEICLGATYDSGFATA